LVKDFWIAAHKASPRERIVVMVLRDDPHGLMTDAEVYMPGNAAKFHARDFDFIGKLNLRAI